MEDDQNGRRPKWKTTKMEDDQNGRRPTLKTQLLVCVQWDQSSPSNIADLIYLKYDGQNKIMRPSLSLDFPMLPPEL